MKKLIKKLYDYLSGHEFPTEDKLRHLLIGDYIAFASFIFFTAIIFTFDLNYFWYSMLPLPSFLIGYMKEYFDRKYSLGYYEGMDIYYTMKMSIQYTLIITVLIIILTIKKQLS
jgi:hypothetical protein